MFDKGFSNVYLLSGGFEDFAAQFPKLLEGKAAEVYQSKSLGKTMGGKKSVGKGKKEMEVTGKVTDGDHKGGTHKFKMITGKVTDPKALEQDLHI